MYRKTIEQTCNELGTDLKSGLTCAEVAARRERDGLNEIEGGKREPFILKLARQFADVLIIILLVAAAVSLIVDPSEWGGQSRDFGLSSANNAAPRSRAGKPRRKIARRAQKNVRAFV